MRRLPLRSRAGGTVLILSTLAAAAVPLVGQGLPSTRPATQPASRPSDPPAQISLTFKDAPIDAVLEHLSDAAGFVVVKEVPVEGRVTVLSKKPVTAAEAVTILNTVLKTNGYTAIQMGRVLKIVGRDRAKKASIPVHFGANPDEIEPSDELITQVIPVGSVDAVRLRQDLAPLIGPEADVTANGGSNALVMTDTSANIRRVVEIVSALDKNQTATSELRRFPLKNANAATTARLLLGIFRPPDQQQQNPQQQQQQQQQRGGRGGRGGGGGSDQALRAHVNAVADDRTNTVFVTAPYDTLKAIEGIVRDLESNPAAASELRIFPLKFADATAASRLVAAIFRPDDARRDGGPRPADQAATVRAVAAADEHSNSLVVTAPAETLKAIADVLAKIDVDPAQVAEVKVLQLTYADATSAAKLVASIFKGDESQPDPNRRRGDGRPDPAAVGRLTAAADERTNSVVVTAPRSTIQVVEDVLKRLDVNPSTSVVRSYPLKNANAFQASSLILALFKPDEGGGVAGASRQPAPAATALERQRRAKLTATSDTRTNTLLISAPPDVFPEIEAVVKDLEANPVSEETFFIYHLKNGQAANVEAVMNTLFGTNSNTPGGAGARTLQNLRRGGGAGGGRNQSAFGSALGASPFGGGGGTGIGSRRNTDLGGLGQGGGLRQGALGGIGNLPQLSQNSARVVNELTGEVFVVADADTNSLLVTTATKFNDRVRQIIEELDRPVPQVLIKVLVAEVTHDDAADFGVDFSVLNRRSSGNGQTGGFGFGNAAAATSSGGLVVQLVEEQVNATLHALATRGKLDVLSRPYILASDNQLASITVGQEVPFITNTRITELGQTLNTIEYQDVGIILSVIPHINPDGQVILDVQPEISQLTGTTVPISEQVNAPVIAKRAAESRVGIRNGQTIVIGGLMEDRKTSTVDRVPILGDLPLVGPLFSRTRVSKSKTELLIFLTPHVAIQPEKLQPMSEEEMQGTKLTPGAVAPGTFDEHLRGMGRGATDIPPRPTSRPVVPATGPGPGPGTTPIGG